MEISYFRSSSYNCHTICEMQYYLCYVLGLPQNTGVAAEKGTIIHKILEILAKAKLLDQEKKKILNDEILGKINILTKTRPYTNNTFVDYIIQPIFDYYNTKDSMNFGKKELKEITKWAYKVVDGKIYDPRNHKIVFAERQFCIPLKKDWAKLKDGNYLQLMGTIDLLVDHNNCYELIDHKSGARKLWTTPYPQYKEYGDFLTDFQSDLYYYVLRKLYPKQYNFLITIHYINDSPVTTTRSEDDIPRIENSIREKLLKIQKCEKPKLKSEGTHFFCKNICHYGKHYIGQKTQCQHIKDVLYKNGMELATAKFRENGFRIDFYEKPG